MKALLAILLAAALPAGAQTTINLRLAPCASGVWCTNVPNDSSGSVLVYGNVGPAQDVGVILGKPDGSHMGYASTAYANGTIYVGTCPAAPASGTITLTNVPMGAAVLNAEFHCTTYTSHSGRGPGAHQVWTLLSGTLSCPNPPPTSRIPYHAIPLSPALPRRNRLLPHLLFPRLPSAMLQGILPTLQTQDA